MRDKSASLIPDPISQLLNAGMLLLLGLLTAGCVGPAGSDAPAVTLLNPYGDVNWATWGQYKANLHTHTTESDGKLDPAGVIRLYHSKGYQILALTDHEKVAYPWTKYGVNAADLGMIAVPGAELYTEAHLNSFYSDITHQRPAAVALQQAAAKHGLVIMNHPASFVTNSPDHFVRLFRQYPQFIGLEHFNAGVEQLLNGIPFWDLMLCELMPARPVWGLGNDDMHKPDGAGLSWNVFLLPELTEAAVRHAMENGCFYLCAKGTGLPPPRIHAIHVAPDRGTLTVETEPDCRVRWLCNEGLIQEGPTLRYHKLSPRVSYVRAEITGPGGSRTCTNPFGLRHRRAAPPEGRAKLMRQWQKLRAAEMRAMRAECAKNWERRYSLAGKTPDRSWLTVDLAAHVNRPLTGPGAWIGASYQLTQLGAGMHRIHGVPFRVLDQTRHNGRAAIALRSKNLPEREATALPEAVTVSIGRRLQALYVLHGAGFVSRHGKIGEYTLQYADGTMATVDIVGLGKEVPDGPAGERMLAAANIQDWWPAFVQLDQPHARKVMVNGLLRPDDTRFLYTLELINPHPDKLVQAVSFRALPDADAVLLILAVTAATLP